MSLELLKKTLKESKLVYGYTLTMKNLKNNKISKIFLASNCPQEFKNKLKNYNNIEVIELKEPNKELALVCKKKFSVNIIGSLKK